MTQELKTTIDASSYISSLASQIEASITMSISALAKQLKSEGKPVIGMSAGEPDFDTPDAIKAAGIKAIEEGQTKYTPASGINELKEAVCDKLELDYGLSYSSDQIVVSCGAKHTLFNLFMALLNPGDEVLIPTPYWVSYPDQVKVLGGTPIFLETTDESQFKVKAKQIEHAITNKTKLLVLNTPSNPTGMVYTRTELEAISQVVIKHNLLVISDEIYAKLIYDGSHVGMASLSPEMKARTLLVDGVSKSYSMTGWRIGYCAVPKPIATVVSRIQSHSTSNPCANSQWASVAALTGTDDVINNMKIEFHKRRDVMVQGLNNCTGIRCLMPQGAFYAFPNISNLFGKISPKGEAITDSVSFCKALLEEALVACVPGSGFGAEGYVRLSYATSMEAINEALERISNWTGAVR